MFKHLSLVTNESFSQNKSKHSRLKYLGLRKLGIAWFAHDDTPWLAASKALLEETKNKKTTLVHQHRLWLIKKNPWENGIDLSIQRSCCRHSSNTDPGFNPCNIEVTWFEAHQCSFRPRKGGILNHRVIWHPPALLFRIDSWISETIKLKNSNYFLMANLCGKSLTTAPNEPFLRLNIIWTFFLPYTQFSLVFPFFIQYFHAYLFCLKWHGF